MLPRHRRRAARLVVDGGFVSPDTAAPLTPPPSWGLVVILMVLVALLLRATG